MRERSSQVRWARGWAGSPGLPLMAARFAVTCRARSYRSRLMLAGWTGAGVHTHWPGERGRLRPDFLLVRFHTMCPVYFGLASIW